MQQKHTETTNTWPHGLNLGSRESPNWTTAKTLWLETWTPVAEMMSSGMDLHFFQKRTWDAMKHLWISWKRISMEFMGPCGFRIWITCSCFKVSAVPTSTASGTTIMSLHRKLQKGHSFHILSSIPATKNIEKHQLKLSTLPRCQTPRNHFFQTFLISTSPQPVFGP